MTGKRAAVALIAALLAFGYVFTLNPDMVEFQIYPGARVRTSLALVLFLFLLAGFGIAVFGTAFKEAIRSFEIWRTHKAVARRDRAESLLMAGRKHAVSGRPKAARKLFQKAHRKTPGQFLVRLEMGRMEIEEGRFDAAERRLKALLKEDPNNAEVLSLLTRLYHERGDFAGQVATLTRWLDIDPGHLPALRSLRDLYQGAGNWVEAVGTQEKIVAKADGRDEREAERARLVELRFRQATARADGAHRGLLERLVRDEKEFAPGHLALGERLAAEGDRDGAVDAWIKGYHLTGQVGLLLRAEAERVAQGRAEDMVKIYRKLAKKKEAAPLLLARLLLELERSDEALRLLERLDGPMAGTRAHRFLTGEVLYRLRSYDGAAKAFREGLSTDVAGPDLAFACAQCGAVHRGWQPACSRCKGLDRLDLDPAAVAPAASV